MAKQEARLKDRTNRPLIAIGTPKRLLEIIDKDPLLVHRTKRLVIDEVDKTLLPLSKRENHPRPAKLLVEKIKKYSRVIIINTVKSILRRPHNFLGRYPLETL